MIFSYLCGFTYIEFLKTEKDSKKFKVRYLSLQKDRKTENERISNLSVGLVYIDPLQAKRIVKKFNEVDTLRRFRL